jgi:hypothetical protein
MFLTFLRTHSLNWAGAGAGPGPSPSLPSGALRPGSVAMAAEGRRSAVNTGSRSPAGGEINIATNLDEFQKLLRQHQVDRVYLDLLQCSPQAGGEPQLQVVMSASRGGHDLVACLPWNRLGASNSTPPSEMDTYRNVLRSRFLFLGYAVSDGLASVRLAHHLHAVSSS